MIDSLSALPAGYLIAMSLWLAGGVLAFVGLLRLRRKWKDRPRRLRWVHVLLSLWMLLAALTGVELYFAVIYDESDSFNMTNVSQKWFRRHVAPQQRTLEIDPTRRIGVTYRDDVPFPTEVGPDQHHICFVGDSFTFGHGIPDVKHRFSNRLRSALATSSSVRFVVSNLADTGKDLPWIELLIRTLLESGPRVDSFVYVMCLNDVEGFAPATAEFYQELGAHKPQFFLFRETYFLNLMYFRMMQFTQPEVRDYYSFVHDYYEGEPWERMRETLADVSAMCRRQQVEFRVVIFPFLHNLGPDYPFRGVHEQIVAACAEEEIPVLDLAPVLAPHVTEGLRVNRFDAHPNERAHALAAAAIEAWLLDGSDGDSADQ